MTRSESAGSQHLLLFLLLLLGEASGVTPGLASRLFFSLGRHHNQALVVVGHPHQKC